MNIVTLFVNKAYKYIKEDVLFIIGNYGLRIAAFGFTIMVAKKISPENYGIFGLATLIVTYLAYLNFGSQYSINKELSLDKKDKRINAYAVLSLIFYSILIIIIFIVVSVFNLFPSLNPYYYYILLYPILFNIVEISNGILRAHNLSKELGFVKLIGTLSIILLMIYYFIKGVPDDPSPLFIRFLLFQTVEVFIAFFFLTKISFFRFTDIISSFDRVYIKRLLFLGLLLSAYVTIDSFTKSIDRLFIASFYSKEDLGYYSFGIALAGPFLLATASIMYMDFSRFLKKFTATTLSEFTINVKHIYKKLFLIWGITLIGAVVLSFFFLKVFLPHYMQSYNVIIVYIFNYFTQILIFPYSSYFIANNLNFQLIKIIILPNLINIGLSYLVVLLNYPYIFILIVSLPTNLLYFFYIKRMFFTKYFISS